MFGVMGMSAAFAKAASAKAQKGNELRFTCSSADPVFSIVSCAGEITVISIKNGEQTTASYSGLSSSTLSIQSDANAEIVITGNITGFECLMYGSGCKDIVDITLNRCLTLERLQLDENAGITSLDVSKNVALTYISCAQTGITSLDVSKNVALTDINCAKTGITSLDVSKNVALTHISCAQTGITSLDVSKNVALTYISCAQTGITSLDLSVNTELLDLDCKKCNLITSLDLSYCTMLNSINITDCISLTSLDLSKCTNISTFNGNNTPAIVIIKYPATNSHVSSKIGITISNANSSTGTVYTDSAGAYYSTIADAATVKGWTIEQL